MSRQVSPPGEVAVPLGSVRKSRIEMKGVPADDEYELLDANGKLDREENVRAGR